MKGRSLGAGWLGCPAGVYGLPALADAAWSSCHSSTHTHAHPTLPPPALQNGETAPDPLPEEKDNINGMQQLSVEATSVNQAFREQVVGAEAGARHALAEACPAELGPEGTGYK